MYLAEGRYEVVLYPGQKEYGVLLETDEQREYTIFAYFSSDSDDSN